MNWPWRYTHDGPEPDLDGALEALGELLATRRDTHRLAARLGRVRVANHFGRDIDRALGAHRDR